MQFHIIGTILSQIWTVNYILLKSSVTLVRLLTVLTGSYPSTDYITMGYDYIYSKFFFRSYHN